MPVKANVKFHIHTIKKNENFDTKFDFIILI